INFFCWRRGFWSAGLRGVGLCRTANYQGGNNQNQDRRFCPHRQLPRLLGNREPASSIRLTLEADNSLQPARAGGSASASLATEKKHRNVMLGGHFAALRAARAQSAMSNPLNSKSDAPEITPPDEPTESFKDIFSEYEKSHARKPEAGSQRREGTVVALTADAVILYIGFKSEGLLPLAELAGATMKPGDKLQVTVKGRD